VKRFHRKRKAPATRSNPVKIQKKDVNLAAETLLELSTTTLHDANEVQCRAYIYFSNNID
jgi:hypothetical protein